MSKGQSVYIKSKRLGADYELASNNNNFIKGLFLFLSALRESEDNTYVYIAGRERRGGGWGYSQKFCIGVCNPGSYPDTFWE